MEQVPVYVGIAFGLTTLLTVGIFYQAAHRSKATLGILAVWLALQALLGISGFYTITDTLPPRFLLLALPALLAIAGLFATAKGRQYVDGLDMKTLTLLHTVRIPVELVLFWLFLHGAVPELMTFEGRNLDILSGLTAPAVYYLGFVSRRAGKKLLLFWNLLCLGLLVNIVAHAVLSAPTPIQQLAFEQPNIAVLHFPFNWLPSCVVPLVLLSHLASLRQLLRGQ
jgi:hypothetical protein